MFRKLPAGTKLYRGCRRLPEIGTDETVYFALSKMTAAEYSRGCIAEVETLKDMDLLDLSQGETWKKLDSFDWGKYERAYHDYKGILYARTDYNDFVERTVQSGLFQDGKVKKAPCKENAAKECTSLDWHGLTWGPEKNQFKRHSSEAIDLQFIEALARKCKEAGFCIAGIYAPPLPAPLHTITDDSGNVFRGVFHEEIALFGLPADAVKLVESGGKRRKTRSKKFKRKMRTRRQ